MEQIRNLHVVETTPLKTPAELKADFPVDDAIANTVVRGRDVIQNILQKKDPRMLVVVGPCSIHDVEGALEYAEKLNVLRQELEDSMFILMRVYFEKPRTTVGWKGLINDPFLDGSFHMEEGLRKALELLTRINSMGLPVATEFLDPIVPQYIAEFVSWAAIGARTTESQTHRQMASGLSMPIGFKNGTDGSLQVAIDAMRAAMNPHSFLGIDQKGQTCIVRTTGTPWGHIVLRGGAKRTNFDPESIADTVARLTEHDLSSTVMVDCSHANSGKQPTKQELVWNSVLDQRINGNDTLIGLMVESHLFGGNQKIPEDLSKLSYGVSVTDPCLEWSATEKLLRSGHEKIVSHVSAQAV